MILHFLYLDIVAGVVGSGIYAERALGIVLPWSWWVVVPAATWCVYIADRLIDVRRVQDAYPTLRHGFIARHRRVLLVSCTTVGLMAAVVGVATFPPLAVIAAVIVTLLFGLHHVFQRVHSTRFIGVTKDLNVAVTYGFAMWVIPITTGADAMSPAALTAMAAHGCMVLGTVVAASVPDRSVDAALDQPSIGRVFGPTGSLAVMITLAVLCGACAWGLRSSDVAPVVAGWTMSLAVLPGVMRFNIPLPLRRMVAELTLAIPLVLAIQP